MRQRSVIILLGCVLALAVAGFMISGQKTTGETRQTSTTASPNREPKADNGEALDRAEDREAIRKSSAAFSAAYAQHDAKACASFWTEQGEYFSDGRGTLRGHKAIEETFAKLFKENPKCNITARIDSIRFISQSNAIETGILKMDPGGKELPTSTRYSVLHVKENGEWKIAFAREFAAEEDRIEDLEWLVGKWSAKMDDREVTFDYRWTPKKAFLRAEFEVKENGKVIKSGVQIITRDPVLGQLRSWIFEHGGGFGEGLWVRDENHWVVESLGVSPEGTETSALNIITRIDKDTFTWNSTERYVDGEEQKDTEPVKVNRVKE